MKRSKHILLIALLMLSIAMAGCQPKESETGEATKTTESAAETPADTPEEKTEEPEEKPEEKPVAPEVTLEDWAGTWNSMSGYFEEAEVAKAIEEAAKEEGEDPEEHKKELLEQRGTDFASFKAEGNKVMFYDKLNAEGEEISAAEYELAGAHDAQHGSREMKWFEFKATDENAKYPVMLLMDVHGEEHMAHFHGRFGDDAADLLAKESWVPTFLDSNTPMDMIVEELGHHHHDHDHDH